MAEEPNGRGLVALLAAHVACCGTLLLVASGALSFGAFASWFLENNIVWPVGIAVIGLALYVGWKRRSRRLESTDAHTRDRVMGQSPSAGRMIDGL